jgi:LysM repeat protein
MKDSHVKAGRKGMKSRTGWFLYASILAIVGLCVGVSGLALASRAYERHYDGRIYPGVSVYGVNLGGLTTEEAATLLQLAFPDPSALSLTLRDGERTWRRSWADLKLRLDPLATADLAYQMGREGPPVQQVAAWLRMLIVGQPISPIVVLPDPAQAAAALWALAPEVAIPPVNATFVIQPEGVIPAPSQAGLELDVEGTIAVLPYAIGVSADGLVMDLLTRPMEPAISDSIFARAQAETVLAHPFTLVADDALTGFSAMWSVEPESVAAWLVAQPVEDENGARLMLTVEQEAVRAYLASLDNPLTSEIALDVEGTISAVQAAVEAVENQATVALAHLPHVYVVQPGDTLTSVAHAHGFPVWRLTGANPGLEPGDLQPGQQITIPSLDVLLPLPLIVDRRIVVDISDQRLYAYEGEALVYDFPCSTGIASSPTIAGTFQVLSKQEEAYASSWDLWMPHFMGIYRTAPDFTNGIHALPILSSGARLWEGYLGRPVSYGCIVVGVSEAAALYEWAELGTLVVIRE